MPLPNPLPPQPAPIRDDELVLAPRRPDFTGFTATAIAEADPQLALLQQHETDALTAFADGDTQLKAMDSDLGDAGVAHGDLGVDTVTALAAAAHEHAGTGGALSGDVQRQAALARIEREIVLLDAQAKAALENFHFDTFKDIAIQINALQAEEAAIEKGGAIPAEFGGGQPGGQPVPPGEQQPPPEGGSQPSGGGQPAPTGGAPPPPAPPTGGGGAPPSGGGQGGGRPTRSSR